MLFIPIIPHRHFVGLAGPPGAGKSTLACEVVRRVNELWPKKVSSLDSQVEPPDAAIMLPMDGFHLYRSELDAMEVSFLLALSTFAILLKFHCLFIALSLTFIANKLKKQSNVLGK